MKVKETISSKKLKTRYKRIGLLTFGIPIFGFLVALILAAFYGLPHYFYFLLLSIFYFHSTFGLEIGYHRYLSHGSFEMSNKFFRGFLVFSGAMAASGPPIYWAATHRLHHKYSDKEKDPHSPYKFGNSLKNKIKGGWHAQLGWMINNDVTNSTVLAKKLFFDEQLKWFEKNYLYVTIFGILLPGVISLLFSFSLASFFLGVLYGGVVRIFFVHLFYIGGLNSICHTFGFQDFKTNDKSKNTWWMVLPTVGESWHNNHHAFPGSACLNFKWWQIDPSGYIIFLCKKLGIVAKYHIPQKDIIEKRYKLKKNE